MSSPLPLSLVRLSIASSLRSLRNTSHHARPTPLRPLLRSSRHPLLLRRASTTPKPRPFAPKTLSPSPSPASPSSPSPSRIWSLINRIPTTFGRSFWLTTLFIALNVGLVLHLFTTHICSWHLTAGPSMLPTLEARYEHVAISRLHRRGRWIRVGDIVSIDHPVRGEYRSIKRVIGMPGDFVVRDTPPDAYEYLEGPQDDLVDEHGLSEEEKRARREASARRAARAGRKHRMLKVPEGCCWVVGDNLEMSRDSRDFGAVPLALVRGKVWLAKGPTLGWRLLRNPLA